MSDSDLVIANNLADVSMDSVFDNQSSCTTRSETTYSNSSVCSSVPLFPTPTPCFATCSYEELWREMKKENLDVQFVMELRILLNLYKWDENVLLEKLTGNEATLKKLYDSAKLPFKRVLKAFKTFRQLETLECDVCLSGCDSSMMLNLHCGHFFCKVCMNGTIKQKVYDRQQVMFCLSDCCDDLIPDDAVMKLLTKEQDRIKFQNLLFESHFQNKKNLRWCQGRDCNKIFKIKTFFSTAVDVGRSRCNTNPCRKEPHEPLEFGVMKVWLGEQLKSSLTKMWLQASTNECPKFDVPINKDGGCNHMQCERHYCWICLHDWKEHDDYYNRFRDAHDKWDDSKKSLEMFYSDRYNQQKQSLILDKNEKVRVVSGSTNYSYEAKRRENPENSSDRAGSMNTKRSNLSNKPILMNSGQLKPKTYSDNTIKKGEKQTVKDKNAADPSELDCPICCKCAIM